VRPHERMNADHQEFLTSVSLQLHSMYYGFIVA